MGTHDSSSTFRGFKFKETYVNSNIYNKEDFIPTIFTFDLNENTGAPINIEIKQIGTILYGINEDDKFEYLSHESVDSYYIVYWRFYSSYYWRNRLGVFNAKKDPYSSVGNVFRFEYTSGSTAYGKKCLFGSFYHAETNKFYLFNAISKNSNEDEWMIEATLIDYEDYEYTADFIKSLFLTGYYKDGFVISPTLQKLKNGDIKQFYGRYFQNYKEISVSIDWNLCLTTESEKLKEIDGVKVSSNGLVEVIETTLPEIQLAATYTDPTDGILKTAFTSIYLNRNDPYIPGGNTSDVGPNVGGLGSFGNGSFGNPENSDPVGNDVPLGSVEGDITSSGFMSRYLCSSSTLETFGDWLWTDSLGLTVAKGIISLFYGDPAQSVISFMSYPFDVGSMAGISTKPQNIFWGNFDSLVPSTIISSQSCYIEWGTISLDEYWGNFLDYAPHTKIELYLPWGPGFVTIDPGQVLPGSIKVTTNIDLMKGSCVHNVIGYSNTGKVSNNVLIGSYAGQCGKQIPVISSDAASKSVGVVVGAVAAGVGVAVGSAVGAAGNAIGTAKATQGITTGYVMGPKGNYINMGSRADRIMESAGEGAITGFGQGTRTGGKIASSSLAINKTPISISRNGGFTDGSASLSVQYPYIILSRPIQSVAENYGSYYGYPSNIYVRLSNLRGYTEIGEIHLDGIPATASELDELDSLLKGGVIF